MATVIVTCVVALLAMGCYLKLLNWRQNYKVARDTGLPVFRSPIHLADFWWHVFSPVLTPFFLCLPKSWTVPWLQLLQPWNLWKTGHEPFLQAGSDNLILATPRGNMLWTADTTVINQLLRLHPKVDQPLELIEFFNIWGPTIVNVHGDEWKAHRRAVSAGFRPGINKIVWEESRDQTEALAQYWMKRNNAIIPSVRKDTSKLTLHVISSGFFKKKMTWETKHTTPVEAGHEISFDIALFTLLSRLATLFMVPKWLLAYLPGRMFKEANLSYTEMTKYFEEMRAGAASDVANLKKKKNKSLLEAIVASAADPEITGKQPLPQETVIGNIFFTVLAGHETSGGTLAFALTFLAVYPELQQQVHEELDRQLGNRPSATWTLDEDYSPLYQGLIGAILKETLYLYNPAQMTMRKVIEPVTIVDSQGDSYKLPVGMLALLNKAAESRNPARWKRQAVLTDPTRPVVDSPATYFNPKRWLRAAGSAESEEYKDEGSKEQDGSAWRSFDSGGRTCPGKAFAETEMTVVIATLLKSYSLELVVPDDILDACSGDAKLAWQKTQEKAISMLYHDIESNISIGLGKDLPIRIEKRGS